MRSLRAGQSHFRAKTIIHSAIAASDTRAATIVIGGIVAKATFVSAQGIPERTPSKINSANSTFPVASSTLCICRSALILRLQHRCVDQHSAECFGAYRLMQETISTVVTLR